MKASKALGNGIVTISTSRAAQAAISCYAIMDAQAIKIQMSINENANLR
jgi:hypothetical protein